MVDVSGRDSGVESRSPKEWGSDLCPTPLTFNTVTHHLQHLVFGGVSGREGCMAKSRGVRDGVRDSTSFQGREDPESRSGRVETPVSPHPGTPTPSTRTEDDSTGSWGTRCLRNFMTLSPLFLQHSS